MLRNFRCGSPILRSSVKCDCIPYQISEKQMVLKIDIFFAMDVDIWVVVKSNKLLQNGNIAAYCSIVNLFQAII